VLGTDTNITRGLWLHGLCWKDDKGGEACSRFGGVLESTEQTEGIHGGALSQLAAMGLDSSKRALETSSSKVGVQCGPDR